MKMLRNNGDHTQILLFIVVGIILLIVDRLFVGGE